MTTTSNSEAHMLYSSLLFQGSLSWDDIKSSFAVVASTLSGEPCSWVASSRRELPAEVGFGALFEEEFVSASSLLHIKVAACGGGNPRDGYLYDLSARLQRKDKDILTLSAASFQSSFEENPITVYAENLDTFELVRQALRATIGAARDRTMTANMALAPIKEAHKQGSPLTQKWLDEALAVGPQPHGWSQLLQLAQEIRGKSPALLMQRLRETPFDASVWREAEQDPPASLSRDLIQSMLSRFAPALPRDATWRICEDGVGPGMPRHYLARELFLRLFSSKGMPSVYQGAASYLMQWGAGPLPAVRREETKDQSAQDHLWGEEKDNCVILWQKGHPSGSYQLGTALCITGDDAFQAKTREIISALMPFRWVKTPFDSLFSEKEPRALGLIDRTKSRAAQLAQLLALVSLPDELMEVYHSCQCKAPYCEHIKSVDARTLAHIEAAKGLSPRQTYESDAVRAVLDALRYSMPNKERVLDFLNAERQIARLRALCAPQDCFLA
jgi:hypothetical protein